MQDSGNELIKSIRNLKRILVQITPPLSTSKITRFFYGGLWGVIIMGGQILNYDSKKVSISLLHFFNSVSLWILSLKIFLSRLTDV